MADNGPISVSSPGVSLIGAASKDITFSTRFPFAKLDSTNTNSFQIVTIFLTKEPPNPTIGNSNSTLIAFIPHGYTYTPSTWFLVSTDNFTTVKGSEGVWLVGDAAGINSATAQLNITVDDTNINFYIAKSYLTTAPPSVIGLFLGIRCYVFVEDLLGNGIPSQA